MKTITIHWVALFFLGALAVPGGASAALFGDDEDIIWQSGSSQYIKYAEQDSTSFGNNDHPVELDPRNIATVLESLRFQAEKSGLFSSGDEEKPVFSVTQARRLAENLAKGLREAGPEQDITFVLLKEVSQLIVLTDQVFVTGRAFYKDGRLNIIIGEYDRFKNEEYERVYDSSGQLAGAYNFYFGSRSSSSNNVPGNVVNMDGIQNKVVNNNVRQDWFVLDVDQAASAIAQQKSQRDKKEEGGMSREMRLEAARMQKEQRELKLEMARMREQMKNSGGGSGGKSVEERLETLEKLYEQEMISKEEYETKRELILSDI